MSRFENRTLTLRDVSEASGVSEMTVSRVLRGRGDVSQETREKVLQAAKSLGYVPNKIAGALASQRVNLISVIIPSMSNMVFPEVLTGINSVLENTELQPVVGVTDYLPEKEEKVLYQMLSWRPSGIIIAGLNIQMLKSDAREYKYRSRNYGYRRRSDRFSCWNFSQTRGSPYGDKRY